MTDSAERAARRIDHNVLRYETREIEARPVEWIAAIIREELAHEAELTELLVGYFNQYQMHTTVCTCQRCHIKRILARSAQTKGEGKQ